MISPISSIPYIGSHQTVDYVRIKQLDRSNEITFSDECAICLSDLRVSSGPYAHRAKVEIVRVNPCNHQFHRACLETWATTSIQRRRHPTCPKCRINLKKMAIEIIHRRRDIPVTPASENRQQTQASLVLLGANIFLTVGLITKERNLVIVASLIFFGQLCKHIQDQRPLRATSEQSGSDRGSSSETDLLVNQPTISYGVADIV